MYIVNQVGYFINYMVGSLGGRSIYFGVVSAIFFVMLDAGILLPLWPILTSRRMDLIVRDEKAISTL